MAKSKKTTYVSMKGIARYPWLNKPDVKFNTDGLFHIDLVVAPEDFAQPARTNTGKTLDITYQELFDNGLEQSYLVACEIYAKDKRKITKTEVGREITDEEGEPTGQLFIPFKQNAIIKPKGKDPVIIKRIPQFDARGVSIPSSVFVGGGSLVKVAFTIRNENPDGSFDNPSSWVATEKKVGLRLDLQAVQVLKLVEGGSSGQTADRFGFGVEDGYEGIEAEAEDEADEDEDVNGDGDF